MDGMFALSAVNQIHQQIYNMDAGLRRWRSDYAKVYTGTNIIKYLNFAGDDWVEGNGASYDAVQLPKLSWYGRLHSDIMAILGNVGTGFCPTNHPDFDIAGYCVTSGSWVKPAHVYGPGQICITTSSNGASATFTFTGTAVDLFYGKDNQCGTFTWAVDGGTAISVDANQAVAPGSSAFCNGIVNITGLADSSHTLVVTNTAAAQLKLIGICPTRGIRGVRCNMMAAGANSAAKGLPAVTKNMVYEIYQPSLTVFMMGANDFYDQTPLATFKSGFNAHITAAKSYGDMLILIQPQNPLITTAKPIPWQAYVDIQKELAWKNNCAFIDFHAKYGSDLAYFRDTLDYVSNGQYANAACQYDMYKVIKNVIL